MAPPPSAGTQKHFFFLPGPNNCYLLLAWPSQPGPAADCPDVLWRFVAHCAVRELLEPAALLGLAGDAAPPPLAVAEQLLRLWLAAAQPQQSAGISERWPLWCCVRRGRCGAVRCGARCGLRGHTLCAAGLLCTLIPLSFEVDSLLFKTVRVGAHLPPTHRRILLAHRRSAAAAFRGV